MVTFGPILTDVAIVASTDASGDVLRLQSTQTIQLLALWDQNGNQESNLGNLGEPQTQPLVLPINYFVRVGGLPTLQGNFQNLLLHLLVIVGFPVLDPFTIDPNSVTGFTSSPMQALFARWGLVRVGFLPPIVGSGLASKGNV
jgi:hypothetical protein